MATTDPVPPSSPVSSPLTPAQAAMPTIGSIVGAAVGKLISAKLGFTDPLVGDTIVTVAAGVVTALFHWAGTTLGGIKA